ncbi:MULTISPECIES: class I SAM-dependent methyltransferase [Providencia]|uniref:class I SAM-dependent methyltransferase n=1 Tax=Providencia TaxID=586 RepID=UPI0012B5DD07|nr:MULTISPECIES: class I SAM-dependent methyltransferase [Providencia]MCX9095251.1 class I SAM-dependent methyltransferase [Providencia rettgeri]MDK7736266.1 class I SAM-dependent methyltransferase [Providencia stuartii]MTB80426.1 methyltransferase domain-containing protein [Providencia stuartii]HEM8344024.1 class I SAM-dependent methyltransferase [Providencia stuartii]
MKNYQNILYTLNPEGDSISFDNKQYYRYMDKLYIPNIPSALELQDVIALSEIRIKLDKSIINYNYTKGTIRKLFSYFPKTDDFSLLDFGSGNGILSEVIKEDNLSYIKKLTGVDACEYATVQSLVTYENNLNIEVQTSVFDNSKALNIKSNSIDGIISSFVMHFKMYDMQLNELHRVLKPSGYFVYNDYVYDKYTSNARRLIKKLKDIGFILIKEDTEFFLEPKSNTLKPQRIMVFTK